MCVVCPCTRPQALTAAADAEMRDKFSDLLAEPALRRHRPAPGAVWEALALIVLFDQLPRNVYRGRPRAYDFDATARPLALGLLPRLTPEGLPFHFRATVLICLCHSESAEHQALLGAHVHGADFGRYERTHTTLWGALRVIHANHASRVRDFGRFPERNQILSRPVASVVRE